MHTRNIKTKSKSSTWINELFNLMPKIIILLIPPSMKERYLDVNKSSCWILKKCINDSIQNVLHSCMLNIILSYKEVRILGDYLSIKITTFTSSGTKKGKARTRVKDFVPFGNPCLDQPQTRQNYYVAPHLLFELSPTGPTTHMELHFDMVCVKTQCKH